MLLPADFIVRIHAFPTKLTLYCSVRSRSYTLMIVEFIQSKDTFAFSAQLIVFTPLTLLQQMIVQSWDLNDLTTLPALSKQRAFFPVVDVKWLLVKFLVITATETTCLIFSIYIRFFLLLRLRVVSFLLSWSSLLRILTSLATCGTSSASATKSSTWTIILLIFLFIIILLSLLTRFLILCYRASLDTVRIYICWYSFLWSIVSNLCRNTLASIDFGKSCL